MRIEKYRRFGNTTQEDFLGTPRPKSILEFAITDLFVSLSRTTVRRTNSVLTVGQVLRFRDLKKNVEVRWEPWLAIFTLYLVDVLN
jgi:hypothetical protein